MAASDQRVALNDAATRLQGVRAAAETITQTRAAVQAAAQTLTQRKAVLSGLAAAFTGLKPLVDAAVACAEVEALRTLEV